MIHSMTAFGNARVESAAGSANIELRSVNSRFLDLTLRVPDDLRFAEAMIRDRVTQAVGRGKVEVRASFARAQSDNAVALDPAHLSQVAQQLAAARQAIPDVPAPALADLLSMQAGSDRSALDPDAWLPLCEEALDHALRELQAGREREGQRLAAMMLDCAATIVEIVGQVEESLPQILAEQQDRIAQRLRDALNAVSPEGFAQISGAELSARIVQEASLFSLRADVAEELSRLRSHVEELKHILGGGAQAVQDGARAKSGARQGSAGKRLDFLFQEMNREANTLGSKAAGLHITRAAVDIKLLIEQMREQAQNIA